MPTLDTYSGSSPIYCGRNAPSSAVPLWLSGTAIDEWREIPNTSGAGGAAIDAFSSFVVIPERNEIFIGLAGGHGQGLDNRVVSLNYNLDQPAWVLRNAASTNTAIDAAYYPDGKPGSHHTYDNPQWCAALNRIIWLGMSGFYGTIALNSPKIASFNPDTNQWDPMDTYADVPAGFYGMAVDKNSDIWTLNGKWDHTTKTHTTKSFSFVPHWQADYDVSRHQLFMLNWGNGQGFNPELGVRLAKVDCNTGVQTILTANPGAALDSLIADKPVYSNTTYDRANDVHLFYPGARLTSNGNAPNLTPERVYMVKPNNGSTAWNVSIKQTTGAVPNPTPAGGAGINGRFKYVELPCGYKGVLALPQKSSNLFFLRTA